jgi:hypothetical protein
LTLCGTIAENEQGERKAKIKMKLSKELDDTLDAISKEVDSWPEWKRSVDLNDLKKMTEPSENCACSGEGMTSDQKPRHSVRATRA